jgi:excisionase family DNA binding protein
MATPSASGVVAGTRPIARSRPEAGSRSCIDQCNCVRIPLALAATEPKMVPTGPHPDRRARASCRQGPKDRTRSPEQPAPRAKLRCCDSHHWCAGEEGGAEGRTEDTVDMDRVGDPREGQLLLTPEQTAPALGIGRTKVYELLKTGRLESVTIGTSRRIPADALPRFVASLRRTSGQIDETVSTTGNTQVSAAIRPPDRTAKAPRRHQSQPPECRSVSPTFPD